MKILFFSIAFMLTAYSLIWFILKKRYVESNKKNKIIMLTIYLLTGTVAGVLFKIHGYGFLHTFKSLNIIATVLLLAYIDHREKIIPNEAVIYTLSVACVLLIVNVFTNTNIALAVFADSFTALLIGVGLFGITKLVSKNGVGMGDVKLVGALGFYLRTYALTGVLIVALISIAVYGILRIIMKKASLKDEIAFAPFIAFGVTICMILGF